MVIGGGDKVWFVQCGQSHFPRVRVAPKRNGTDGRLMVERKLVHCSGRLNVQEFNELQTAWAEFGGKSVDGHPSFAQIVTLGVDAKKEKATRAVEHCSVTRVRGVVVGTTYCR